jgi:uncharacterized protein YxeA
MDIKLLVVVVVIVVLITLSYKFLPFREAGAKKPLLSIFPKYKKLVKHSLSDAQLEEKLSEFGFKKTKQKKSVSHFSRESVLGDISINLAKVDVSLREVSTGAHEITVQAGWVAAFDTGDHWQFITELGNKIENA